MRNSTDIQRVYMMPTPVQAAKDLTNSINQIVLKMEKWLPSFNWEVTSNLDEADIIAGHAGQTNKNIQVDVAITHGLYPTYRYDHKMFRAANNHVIENIKSALLVTAPSAWVADVFKREFHIEPEVIPWAIDANIWDNRPHKGYTLWNKTRSGGVCDPSPIEFLADKLSGDQFISTFGKPSNNLKIVGRIPFPQMKTIIEESFIYLATTRETYGISTLEAMAAGNPILGYRWASTADIVEHGVTGYLAEPDDLDDLLRGWHYCQEHYGILGHNGRQIAAVHSWDKSCAAFVQVFNRAYNLKYDSNSVKVSVVIPTHNYAHWLGEALDSVVAQEITFDFEVIVVNDASADHTDDIVAPYTDVNYIKLESNVGVAEARNTGIKQAVGDFIVCLDADDKLGQSDFLQKLYDKINTDRQIGIVYGQLGTMVAEGDKYTPSAWPHEFDLESQIKGSNQVPSCCMFRKKAWRQAGGYRWYLEPSEDANLWTRIMGLGFKAVYEPSALYLYRMHDASLSAGIRKQKESPINWLRHLTGITGKHKPIGYIGKPQRWSWDVRDYDLPKVSIVIPVGPEHEDKLLRRALDSVEGQDYPYWECIVVNDTGQPLNLYGYPWITVIDIGIKNGPSKARNIGIQKANAPMIAFLDADDYFSFDFLSKCITAYVTHNRYTYVDWTSINKDNHKERHKTSEYDPNRVFKETSIHSINILIPRQWLLNVGGFDEKMFSWEDVDLFMKLAKAGYCGVRVPYPLVTYDYRTGKLREYGETIKTELKALLNSRYAEYIKGNTMCDCGNTIKPSETIVSVNGNQNMVRISYNGGNVGKATVKGIVTEKNYGRRRQGDIFYIYQEDYQAASNLFLPVAETMQVIESTTKKQKQLPPVPMKV